MSVQMTPQAPHSVRSLITYLQQYRDVYMCHFEPLMSTPLRFHNPHAQGLWFSRPGANRGTRDVFVPLRSYWDLELWRTLPLCEPGVVFGPFGFQVELFDRSIKFIYSTPPRVS